MTDQELKILQDASKERHKNKAPYIWPWEVEKFVVKKERKKKEYKNRFSDEAIQRRGELRRQREQWAAKQAAAKAIAEKINSI